MEYTKPKERPEIGKFYGFDHVTFWVGNAKQAASYYTSRFGFEYLAYQGLETNQRKTATHVVSRNKIILAFQSSYEPSDSLGIGKHVSLHGDGVHSIAFTVENCQQTYEVAVKRGAQSISPPEKISDSDGEVILASVKTYGDTIHTFVERKNYKGIFLPGFKAHHLKEPFNKEGEEVAIDFIDHIVGNMAVGDMEPTVKWYEEMLDFHRFWSVDDKIMHTEYSALNSIVVADYDEVIKMPINEPAKGKRKSQIQEYVDYYAGAGVQHIALNTRCIIDTVKKMRSRGIEFL